MRIELKIEILKVFSVNFSFCSEKKEKKDEKISSTATTVSK
jgi:hypothetical protein